MSVWVEELERVSEMALRGGSPEGQSQGKASHDPESLLKGAGTNFFSTCRAGNFGTSPAQCRIRARVDSRAQHKIFWLILVPLFAWCGRDGLRGQTLVNAPQVPWQQVDFSACGGSPRVGTMLNIGQIRQPQPSSLQAKPAKNPLERPMSGPFSGPPKRPMALMQITPLCWPADLQDNAWSIVTTKCTRCHGETGPPPDTLLTFQAIRGEVGNLDLRTFASMRTGGNRGPAVIPGDSSRSFIYRFTSLLISAPPTDADVQALDALDTLFPRMAILMPPYPMGLQPAEIAALKDWIEAGCPMVR